ncbi:unnamed protein product [Bemisia tabaci]|uniref:Etoposide-induced protein 2.4 n=1 Tax=Bemisia tabaci TaxID=7038 RepID=A0A9P0ALD8_BEMTA|nr:PREDICTED: etoposide-induced protein 2.4 homolog [Bemisia tabaci]CAH0395304.1 unnamed protein product [Bemisia tabaci]
MWSLLKSEFLESIWGITVAVARGIIDSLKGAIILFYLDNRINEKATRISTPRHQKKEASVKVTPLKERKVLKRTLQCCALNGGIFWLSILIFECACLPSLKYVISLIFSHSPATANSIWFWVHLFLSWTFSTVWVLPLFFLSKVVNSLWFQDIADSAYRYSQGKPQNILNISKLIADSFFSILVQALFLVQSMVVSMIPIVAIGQLLSLMHMCLLYSLYAFEYKWCNMGWELHRRLTFIENNWPYFIGFGLPLAILTELPKSYFVSGCVFSILFPLWIISGNEANPVMNSNDCPLRLFSPVIVLSNAVFNRTFKPSRR